MAVSNQQSAVGRACGGFQLFYLPQTVLTEKRKLRTEAFILACPTDNFVFSGTALRREARLAPTVY